jgi:aspartyl-tRNA(Asn)/glutamyl-tRNA(Gln) amidotransferase subunit C
MPPISSALPMALTPLDVQRIAHLARLELSADEQSAMLGQLNGFFGIVEKMSAVDTSGVEPLYTPLSAVQDVSLRLREDKVTECNERERNQRSAPAVEDGLFLVPKVIE